MNERLKNILKLKEEYERKISEEGAEILKQEFKDFFEKYPYVEAVEWVQYTPYFNDGEECIFGVMDPRMIINLNKYEKAEEFKEAEKAYKEKKGYNSYENDDDREQFLEEGEDNNLIVISYLYGESPSKEHFLNVYEDQPDVVEDVYKCVFGDHVEVLATREGFEVHEYDHD